jgi:hypothetical protein
MKKLSLLVLFVIGGLLINGCGQVINNTSDNSGTSLFNSVGEKMKECAPNTSGAAGLNEWEGWSITADYGILKEVFNLSSGVECIFSGATNLDTMLSAISEALESVDSSGNINTSVMGFDLHGKYSDFLGSVSLPNPIGGSSIPYTDIPKKVTLDVYNAGIKQCEIELYYGITNNIQTIVYQNNNLNEDSKSIAYAIIDDTNKTISYKEAFAFNNPLPNPGSQHTDSPPNFRCYMQFEGDYLNKTSKFSLKTNACEGGAVMGGGSVANDNSKYAIRATSEADSATYSNDASNLSSTNGYYVILSRSEIYSGATPAGGETTAQLNNPYIEKSLNAFLTAHTNYTFKDGMLTVTGKMTYEELIALKAIFTSDLAILDNEQEPKGLMQRSRGWPKLVSSDLTIESEDARKYITMGNPDCLGWTNYYPATSANVTLILN